MPRPAPPHQHAADPLIGNLDVPRTALEAQGSVHRVITRHLLGLHAAVRCAADDRRALEPLCRYITRPALASERVQTNAAAQLVLNAKLRARVVPQEPEAPTQEAKPAECEADCAHHRPARLSWAKLLKRVFEIDMEHCPNCGGELFR